MLAPNPPALDFERRDDPDGPRFFVHPVASTGSLELRKRASAHNGKYDVEEEPARQKHNLGRDKGNPAPWRRLRKVFTLDRGGLIPQCTGHLD